MSECDALVWERPHFINRHPCPNAAKHEVRYAGSTLYLCGVHKRVKPRELWLRPGWTTRERTQP